MKNYIDVSHWQGTINWDAVKASGLVQGAIIKAGGGGWGIYADPQFKHNWYECRRVGLDRGAYWYAGGLSPIEESNLFLSLIYDAVPEDILALDLEGLNHYQQWA